MRKAFGAWTGWVLALAACNVSPCGAVAQQQPPPAPAAAPAAQADAGAPALAERIATVARTALSGNITITNFRLCAALMESAAKLDPSEPRYARLWADAALQASDADGAIRALKAYTNLVPDDKAALIQLADLYVRSYQTVDARLGYLRGVVDVKALPAEVRSHLAFLLYQAYSERAQTTEAKAALDQALTLNPLNMEALRVRYDQQVAHGTPAERFATLLAVLKSNPAQLQPLAVAAQQLSEAGLAQESLNFYSHGVDLAQRQGTALPPSYALAYAVELAILPPQSQVANAPQLAKQLDDAVLAGDPQSYEALLIRLLLQRAAGQKDDAAKTAHQALNALNNRLAVVRQTLGDKSATTRPVDLPDPVVWGSFEADLAKLKDLKPAEHVDPTQVREEYCAILTEAAWFQIYFNEKPADAVPLIDALRKVLPENSPVIPRLEGWSFLMRGDQDQAKVKLSAVKDRDPMAELGLIKMAGPAGAKDGAAFVAAHPNGAIALVALDALRDARVTFAPDPAKTAPYLDALKSFPATWLSIIDAPQSFYVIRAEPQGVAHPFGEPMMVRVSIQNVSDQPITIGSEGVLHPDVWLDAQVRGAVGDDVQKTFPATAVDRIARETVLKPKQAVSQVMRLDQGALSQLLGANPWPALQVTFQARTNPTATGIGPAGQIVNGARLIDRTSFPLMSDSITRLGTTLQQGTPAEKIRSLDLASEIETLLLQQQQQQANSENLRIAQQLFEVMKTVVRDPTPSVQAWGSAVVSRFLQGSERLAYLTRLTNDPYWPTRLIGLISVTALPAPDQRTLLKQAIDHDTNAQVVEVAKSLSRLLEQAAAAAATRPTSGPAVTTTGPTPLTPGVGTAAPAAGAATAPAVTIPTDVPLTLPPQAPPAGK